MLFDLTGKVAIITGGAGLLGQQHAAAIAEAGGIPVWFDVNANGRGIGYIVDITKTDSVWNGAAAVLDQYGRIDILINNAANNSQTGAALSFEQTDTYSWWQDLDVGLTGAMLCSQIIGGYMAQHGGGVIVNIGSDFAHLAPDQRVYAPNIKPVSYSVVKHGLLGLTRYLATYWADKNVRVNMLSPGGIENGQPPALIQAISDRVPLGRMAQACEFQGALLFLCSDASSFMTGQELIVDGGRSVW